MVWILVGVVLGALAAFPAIYVLAMSSQKHQFFSLGVVLACGIVPFLCLSVVLLAVNSLVHEVAVPLAQGAAGAFLATIVLGVIAVRPWR